jgi:hypothetical protein
MVTDIKPHPPTHLRSEFPADLQEELGLLIR